MKDYTFERNEVRFGKGDLHDLDRNIYTWKLTKEESERLARGERLEDIVGDRKPIVTKYEERHGNLFKDIKKLTVENYVKLKLAGYSDNKIARGLGIGTKKVVDFKKKHGLQKYNLAKHINRTYNFERQRKRGDVV